METDTHLKASGVCGMDACSRLKPVPDQLIGGLYCTGASYSTVQHVQTSPPPHVRGWQAKAALPPRPQTVRPTLPGQAGGLQAGREAARRPGVHNCTSQGGGYGGGG